MRQPPMIKTCDSARTGLVASETISPRRSATSCSLRACCASRWIMRAALSNIPMARIMWMLPAAVWRRPQLLDSAAPDLSRTSSVTSSPATVSANRRATQQAPTTPSRGWIRKRTRRNKGAQSASNSIGHAPDSTNWRNAVRSRYAPDACVQSLRSADSRPAESTQGRRRSSSQAPRRPRTARRNASNTPPTTTVIATMSVSRSNVSPLRLDNTRS
ncbi:hypothetical protein ACVWXO_008225 [Bradyrhizobium sp. LM2.7]